MLFSALDLINYKPSIEEITLLENFEVMVAREIILKNALLYLAGYVSHRYKHIYPDLGVPTKTLPVLSNGWLSFLSRGNFICQSASFLRVVEVMDHEFEKFHGNLFNK